MIVAGASAYPRVIDWERLGHSERDRIGVYGLGGLWRFVGCMVIGVIGAVKVFLCVIVGR